MDRKGILVKSILLAIICMVIFSSSIIVYAKCFHDIVVGGICQICKQNVLGESNDEEEDKPSHTHNFSSATCTEAARCSCGATGDPALGHSPGEYKITTAATCSSLGVKTQYCTRCSTVLDTDTVPKNPNAHNWVWESIGTANNFEGKHRCYCSYNNEHVLVEWENHTYSDHTCQCGTTYAHGSEHRFDAYAGTCTAYGAGCSATLGATVTFDNSLPLEKEYKMIDASVDYPHKNLSTVTVTFNHIPYISSADGKSYTGVLPNSAVSFDYYNFTHGNYNEHLAAISHSLINKAENVTTAINYARIIAEAGENAYLESNNYGDTYRIVYNAPAVGSIDLAYGDWKGLFGKMSLLQTGEGNIPANSGGQTVYTMDASSISGHAAVKAVYVNFPNNYNVLDAVRLFCNGDCTAGSVPIYAHLNVCYRTVNGEAFDGLDDSLIKTSVRNGTVNNSTISFDIQHGIPDMAGYRYVGYTINEGTLVPASPSDIEERGYITNVSVPMSFSTSGINKSITFFYEKVKLTIRHYNMTDGKELTNGLRQITTASNLTKTVTFNNDPVGTVPLHDAYPDYSTESLNKFWWPAYNLENAKVSTNNNPNFDANHYRNVSFYPYKVFESKYANNEELTEVVNSSSNISTIIRNIYAINNSELIIDVIERMQNDSEKIEIAKNNISNDANILVYAREKIADFIENRSDGNFQNADELNMITTKLVTVLEDLLLSDNDKIDIVKKTITVPYATSNSKISEEPGNRSDKYINYYYTTTEIMVNNINSDTGAYMQSKKDDAGLTHNLRTKVAIRDTIFRAESLITTPPAIDGYMYDYSVYDPLNNTYTRREYNISGFILEKFDIKVGDEVLLEVTKDKAEEWYKIDGTDTELYPPFTDQFIIDTSISDGISPYISSEIAQIDLNRLDKDASVNFYYKDVSLLRVKYVRDTDYAEIYPGKSIILDATPINLSPEDLTPDYEYKEYILDGLTEKNTPVSVAELPNGQDRELIFVYKVPELEVVTPETQKQYVDLRSNDRVAANQIKQEMYSSAPDRLSDGKYSDTYKSLEEYNSYNDAERLTNQTNEGIPTLEDIYANVVTEHFLMDNALTMQPTTQKMKLKIVKKYYETNTKDDNTIGGSNPENQIIDNVKIVEVQLDEMEVPYQYYGASGADLKIIEDAIVYNNVIIENGVGINQTQLIPSYEKPYMNYTKNGYLHLPVDRNYDSAISGMTDYRGLEAGFYSVKNPTNRNDVFEAVWVLSGIDEYEPKVSNLKREYQDANGLVLTALQNAGTLVKPDRLTVTYNYSANGKEEGCTKEFLVVTDKFNTNAVGAVDVNNNMRLGRTYTAETLEKMEILHIDDIPLIGTDVLYKNANLFVESKTTNGTHGVSQIPKFSGKEYEDNTVAEVKYILYQIIKNEEVAGGPAATSLQTALGAEYDTRYNEAIRTQTIIGHPVVVHTPVVNASKFDLSNGGKNEYSDANKHTVNDIKVSNGTIVLGQRFDLSIPNTGNHINAVGYGNNKEYNYKGLLANGSRSSKDNMIFATNLEKFAIIKQVRFDKVGVILYTKDASGNITGGNYYEKNTWINLPFEEELYTFTVPEWEEEIWDNREITVETRVAAENIPDYNNKTYYASYNYVAPTTENSHNKLKTTYGVWKTFGFKVIGELRDLEIRATNDPGFSNYKTEGSSSLPLGQLGQGNGGNAYKYGVKLGYSVYFDITSTGWTGDTTETVKLTPKYYYVSKAGGEAKPVDLYYKLIGNPNYVQMYDSKGIKIVNPRPLSTIMSIDAVKGSRCKSIYALWKNRELIAGLGFFNANAGQEMSNTSRLITALKTGATNYVKNKPVVNYSISISTGDTNLIELPYSVRLAYTNAVNAMLSQKYAGVADLNKVSDNAKNYCIGHWYGAFKLPATTVVVNPGDTPKLDKSNTLKDGYIIVTFEDVHSEKTPEKDYLEVGPERYKQEGVKDTFTLPNGKIVDIPLKTDKGDKYIPAVIYETNIAMNQDAEVGGTH